MIKLLLYGIIIFFLRYEKPYTVIHLLSGKTHHVTIPVSEMAGNLPLPLAMCSQSAIINLWHVKFIQIKKSDMFTTLSDDSYFPISRRCSKIFRDKYLQVKATYFKCDQCFTCIFCNKCNRLISCIKNNHLLSNNQELIIIEKDSLLSILYSEILSITASKYNSIITTIQKKCILIKVSVSNIIGYLPPSFFLCNQSTIINLSYMTSLEEKNTYFLIRSSVYKLTVKVSKRNKKLLMEKLELMEKTVVVNKFCLSCKLAPTCKIEIEPNQSVNFNLK